jgi:hypothetical protein
VSPISAARRPPPGAALSRRRSHEMLGVSRSTAEADWTYAKAWLKRELEKNP